MYIIKTFKTRDDYVNSGKYWQKPIKVESLPEAKKKARKKQASCYKVTLQKEGEYLDIPFITHNTNTI